MTFRLQFFCGGRAVGDSSWEGDLAGAKADALEQASDRGADLLEIRDAGGRVVWRVWPDG